MAIINFCVDTEAQLQASQSLEEVKGTGFIYLTAVVSLSQVINTFLINLSWVNALGSTQI